MAGSHAAGLTSPLLLRADGQKFGKSEGGNDRVWLDATLTSPFALHQFLLNSDDATTPSLLKFFTFLAREEIEALEAATLAAPQERRAQRTLANEVVSFLHGREAAHKAEGAGEALFAESIAHLDEQTLLEVVADAPSSTVSLSELREGIDPVDLLVRCELASSKGEARRFVEQGGVYVNNLRVSASDSLGEERLLHARYIVVRRGRRSLHVLVVV